MAINVEPTTTITLDNSVYEVSKMSADVQAMIRYFDDWREREANLTSELLMVRGAMRDLQNTLVDTIQRQKTEALQKAKDLGIINESAITAEAVQNEDN